MKKVGIMSMQRIVNYGSFLQAYALSNIIKSLGHEVEFVDFKIEPCIAETSKPLDINKLSEKDKYYFDETEKFIKKFSDEFLKELGVDKRNERPELDTLVIGSDEVFNCLQGNPDVGYSLELFGKDNKAKKVITYAASCGSTTVERIKEYNKHDEISKLLNQFDAISVRDINSKNFIETLSNKKTINNLDPVLIYDFKDDVKDNVNIKDYIIVYAYFFNLTEEESRYIKEFAQKNNKKIVAIGAYQSCADIYIPAHPLEVIPYFEKADLVITNTFHGTIFSIKSHTPFVTSIKEYNKQKLTDLLDRLELSDRIIESLSQLDTAFSNYIDFSNTDRIIEREKNRSIKYLKENI